MSTDYEYIDEVSIDQELICSICQLPFDDPRHTPCGETFCYKCITDWIETKQASCPLCRKPLSVNGLTHTNRMVINMLDRIPVKCTRCGQTDLQRGSFDDHILKVCPTAIVTCSSADIQCPWRGERDQLSQHLTDCRFETMRPVINPLTAKIDQLKDRVQSQEIQIVEQQNEIKQFRELMQQQDIAIDIYRHENQRLKEEITQLKEQIQQQDIQTDIYRHENQRLKEEITRLKTDVNAYQYENQQFIALLTQNENEKDNKTTESDLEEELVELQCVLSSEKPLGCGGHMCPKCLKCRDWYDPGLFSSFKKYNGATCCLVPTNSTRDNDPYVLGYIGLAGSSHLCRCQDDTKKTHI